MNLIELDIWLTKASCSTRFVLQWKLSSIEVKSFWKNWKTLPCSCWEWYIEDQVIYIKEFAVRKHCKIKFCAKAYRVPRTSYMIWGLAYLPAWMVEPTIILQTFWIFLAYFTLGKKTITEFMNMISINLPFFFKAFGKKILEPGKRKPSNFQAWSVTSHWDTKFWWSFGGKALWPGGRLCFRRKVSCSFFYLSIKRRFSYLYLDLWYLVWKLFLLFFFWMWSVVKVLTTCPTFWKGMTPISLDEGGRCETPVGCIGRPLPMVLQVPVADPFLK